MEPSADKRPPAVHRNREILGGTPVFVGTRVPLRNLIDYLEGGHTVTNSSMTFLSISRDQAIAALEALEFFSA